MTNRNDLVERLEFLAKTACLPPDSLEAIREAADALRAQLPDGEAVAWSCPDCGFGVDNDHRGCHISHISSGLRDALLAGVAKTSRVLSYNWEDLLIGAQIAVAYTRREAHPAPSAAVDAWVPVSERLPEAYTVVALLNADEWMNTGKDNFDANRTGTGWLCDWTTPGYWSVIGERGARCIDAYTHWMPLPPAPTASNEGEEA